MDFVTIRGFVIQFVEDDIMNYGFLGFIEVYLWVLN